MIWAARVVGGIFEGGFVSLWGDFLEGGGGCYSRRRCAIVVVQGCLIRALPG